MIETRNIKKFYVSGNNVLGPAFLRGLNTVHQFDNVGDAVELAMKKVRDGSGCEVVVEIIKIVKPLNLRPIDVIDV